MESYNSKGINYFEKKKNFGAFDRKIGSRMTAEFSSVISQLIEKGYNSSKYLKGNRREPRSTFLKFAHCSDEYLLNTESSRLFAQTNSEEKRTGFSSDSLLFIRSCLKEGVFGIGVSRETPNTQSQNWITNISNEKSLFSEVQEPLKINESVKKALSTLKLGIYYEMSEQSMRNENTSQVEVKTIAGNAGSPPKTDDIKNEDFELFETKRNSNNTSVSNLSAGALLMAGAISTTSTFTGVVVLGVTLLYFSRIISDADSKSVHKTAYPVLSKARNIARKIKAALSLCCKKECVVASCINDDCQYEND